MAAGGAVCGRPAPPTRTRSMSLSPRVSVCSVLGEAQSFLQIRSLPLTPLLCAECRPPAAAGAAAPGVPRSVSVPRRPSACAPLPPADAASFSRKPPVPTLAQCMGGRGAPPPPPRVPLGASRRPVGAAPVAHRFLRRREAPTQSLVQRIRASARPVPRVTAAKWAITDCAGPAEVAGCRALDRAHVASLTKIVTAHMVCLLAEAEPAALNEHVHVSVRAPSRGGGGRGSLSAASAGCGGGGNWHDCKSTRG